MREGAGNAEGDVVGITSRKRGGMGGIGGASADAADMRHGGEEALQVSRGDVVGYAHHQPLERARAPHPLEGGLDVHGAADTSAIRKHPPGVVTLEAVGCCSWDGETLLEGGKALHNCPGHGAADEARLGEGVVQLVHACHADEELAQEGSAVGLT